MRSSQPLVGLQQKRSVQDEKLIEAAFSTGGNSAENMIVDARPTANALANTAVGAGSENMEYYRKSYKEHFHIDNIHVMRDSLEELISILDKKTTSASYGWLEHQSAVLQGTQRIVDALQTSHVLVHCSDGWDRTSQLVALSQICIDPFYRTINGLIVLVEKDWLGFGHRFSDRCGHGTTECIDSGWQKRGLAALKRRMRNEKGPIFQQFLECCYQLWIQNPIYFEWDEKLLYWLHVQSHACQFTTFLHNCPKERSRSGWSAWSWMLAHKNEFVNPLYVETDILIRPQARHLKLCPLMYSFNNKKKFLS